MLQSKSPPAPSVLSCLRRKTICIIILEFKVRVFLQNYYSIAFWKNSLQSPKTWKMVSYVPINLYVMPVTILKMINVIALIHLLNKTITERMFIIFFGLYRNRMLDTSIAIGKSVVAQPVARRKQYEK